MFSSLVLLRHALAGDRASWIGNDRHRPLDMVGLAQSLALATTVGQRPLDQILTSPYARCQQTVAPMAAIRRLSTDSVSWLEAGASADQVASGLADLGGRVLLCTHGECVPGLTAAIGCHGEVRTSPPSDLEKGAALVFTLRDGVFSVDLVPAPTAAHTMPLMHELGFQPSSCRLQPTEANRGMTITMRHQG